LEDKKFILLRYFLLKFVITEQYKIITGCMMCLFVCLKRNIMPAQCKETPKAIWRISFKMLKLTL